MKVYNKNVACLILIIIPLLVAAQNDPLKVVSNKMVGSDCNTIVHNLLPADASNRTPSDCEVQFYNKVMNNLQRAFSKLMRNWPVENQWKVADDTLVKPLDQISKNSEKYFFHLPGFYLIDMKMSHANEEYKAWVAKYGMAMQDMQTNPGDASFKKFTEVSYDLHGATEIRLMTNINGVSDQIHFFKGAHTFNIPGAAYAVKGKNAQSLTGGDIEDSRDACLILFGKPRIDDQQFTNGQRDIKAVYTYPKASKLTVQHIAIRIECNGALLEQLLKQIDFNVLKEMIGK